MAAGESLASDVEFSRARLTTPRAAAVAGILFSVLLATSLVMIRITVPADPREMGAWLTRDAGTVTFAVHLMPFAGIAFLWFIGVLRDRLGAQEDKFFATVFFGSGLLFLATLFAFAAVAGGLLRMYASTPELLVVPGIYAFGRTVSFEIMNVYTMRMAGVFMITTSTLGLRTGIVPRWMASLGLLLALALLLSLGSLPWVPLAFPLWVFMVSVHILFANLRPVRR
jgi:hypothetical protein